MAIEAVSRAAELIRSRLDATGSIGSKSSPSDVFTQTDIDSEQLIRDLLGAATPGAGFIGEEGGETAGAMEYAPTVGSPAPAPADRSEVAPTQGATSGVSTPVIQWVIDPLDGTVNFTYGIPLFAVSIAAAVDGLVVAGAVIDVLKGEVFSAALGFGARLDGQPIAASDCTELADAMVMTGFSYRAELRRIQGAVVCDLLPLVRDIRCFGSAALELCWVAAGRVDGYYERDTKLWDFAAGALIASEAGAEVELPCPENDGLSAAAPAGLFPSLRAAVEHFVTSG
jgi:myo-inositol-1(or 4)-monophosphatase